MFRCELCLKIVPPKTPAVRRVCKTRRMRFPKREHANVFWVTHELTGKRRLVITDDPGGTGTQIVQEALCCPSCAGEHTGNVETSAKLSQNQAAHRLEGLTHSLKSPRLGRSPLQEV